MHASWATWLWPHPRRTLARISKHPDSHHQTFLCTSSVAGNLQDGRCYRWWWGVDITPEGARESRLKRPSDTLKVLNSMYDTYSCAGSIHGRLVVAGRKMLRGPAPLGVRAETQRARMDRLSV
ncbi:hypothetical protein CALCODRAFT_109209 [Calocera cornea HHB12733]|uniref:Uncharacterized protein n=1 Tax=Calocera cornea HHB12733 TaxID=1353952 RepID=A0A165D2R8_9BASI|nr:hypothetical protein CALCODRAFT_109209 [Calocera cornea HHB12733]